MRTSSYFFAFLCILLLGFSCSQSPVEDSRKLPVIETSNAQDITEMSALCKGIVVDMGDLPSSNFGIELNDGSGYGKYLSTQRSGNEFGVSFNHLSPATTYIYRAFSENGSVNYGNEKSFTTLNATSVTALIDSASITTHSLLISFSNTNKLREWGAYYSKKGVTENDEQIKEISKVDILIERLKAGTTYQLLPYFVDDKGYKQLLEIVYVTTKESPYTIPTYTQQMVLGTYNDLPRLENGRADIPKLMTQLSDLNANTYNWLVWKGENDWDDLKLFLPIAKQYHISVWITLVPPSESKPIAKWSSEPYRTDYVKWCTEIAKLSVEYPNLVAFSIDDFTHNLTTYTSSYMEEMLSAIDQLNPEFQFIPCSYYKQITPAFVSTYQKYFDGILFPYRAESDVTGANLKNPDLVKPEIERLRDLFSPGFPIYLDVYSHAHSKLGASTPEYVEKVIDYGGEYADGVLIYCHPNPVTFQDKYAIVKSAFNSLSSVH